MASIERTAYPRFRRFMSARELHVFYTPATEEIAWAQENAGSDEHLLGLVIRLKTFSRLGYFPALSEVPAEVVGHIRRSLRLPEANRSVYASTRTAERHRNLIRARSEVVYDPAGARKVAAEATEEAARRKNDPADLINIALERLVEGSYELPAFRTLNDMAATIRARVNEEIFALVAGRLGQPGAARLQRLLVTGAGGKSEFYQLTRPARRPSWSKFRKQLERLRWIEDLRDARAWWQGVAPSKIADFAGEAAAADAAVMSDYSPAKRIALLAALVFTAQTEARDDTAEMFCRRVGTLTKRAREELEALKDRHREITEWLVAAYRSVLEQIDPDGEAAAREQAALEQARTAVETAGGFAAQYRDIDTVAAHHGDNHIPLVARHFRKDRTAMLAMVDTLGLEATSADASVLDLLGHVRTHAGLTRDYIPDHVVLCDEDGTVLLDEHGKRRAKVFDTSFASGHWNAAIRDRKHPGMFVRRHLEACVFTYLAEQLRTGDIAVDGAGAYANWAAQLISPARCAQLLADFCAEVGLPATARGFREALESRLAAQCADADAGYPDNAGLVIDDKGRPSLKKHRAPRPTETAVALEAALRERMPERTLLGILARTAHWLEWHRRFAPASGSDPKLDDPLLRYVLTTFCYGTNMGPAQTARHITAVTAHELSVTARRHVTVEKLNKAIADVVNAFTELDLIKAWGDGSVVAADGTQVDTFIDNLLAETSIRYGGTGGIGYYYISDTYIALFSKFIPVGVWEAVPHPGAARAAVQGDPLEGAHRHPGPGPARLRACTLVRIRPDAAGAELERPELLPARRRGAVPARRRAVRRARPQRHRLGPDRGPLRGRHAGGALGPGGQDLLSHPAAAAVDLLPAQQHLQGLPRDRPRGPDHPAAAVPLRRPAQKTHHRRDQQGRVLQQVLLLVPVRQRRRDRGQRPRGAGEDPEVLHPAGQRGHLPPTVDMMTVIRELIGEGWQVTPEDLAVLSPYVTARIQRFGVYATDEIALTPEPFNARLVVDLAARS
jgi:Tn3 transposase DDE domain/Domain of unknown function (DUF4158)